MMRGSGSEKRATHADNAPVIMFPTTGPLDKGGGRRITCRSACRTVVIVVINSQINRDNVLGYGRRIIQTKSSRDSGTIDVSKIANFL